VAWLNERFVRLPTTIGVMAIALLASLTLVALLRRGVLDPRTGIDDRAGGEAIAGRHGRCGTDDRQGRGLLDRKRESPSGAASNGGLEAPVRCANPWKSLPTLITICLAERR